EENGATVHAEGGKDASRAVGARGQPSGGGRERGALGGRGERDPGPCSEGGAFLGLGASAQRRGARRAALRGESPRGAAAAGLRLPSPRAQKARGHAGAAPPRVSGEAPGRLSIHAVLR